MIPPLPSDIFAPGQVLNTTYEVEGVIGRGGTGEVYRARNLISERVVAIKALSHRFSGNTDYLELMRREERMRDVSHDAVVRYTECSRSAEGQVFLVMDLVEGPSLQEEMTQRRMEARELLIVAHRVAEGLAAAHAHGIVHRDLSPDNVILRGGAPERATIIDFGIAKDTAAGARTIVGNDFAGKYEYAAPEQLEGRSDARSDLYALGALLLAAWRGEVPLAGATPGEIVRRKQAPLDTEGVPEPLKGLIRRLAAPDPADRPASAAEVLAQVEPALRAGRGPEREARRSRGRRGLPAVLVGLLLVVAASALWWTGRLDPLIRREPPLADPYRLSASVLDGPRLSGHAPDADAALLLRRAFGSATGAMPPEDALALARGVPGPGWATGLAGVIDATQGLEEWSVEAEGAAVRVAGLAPDRGARDEVAARMEEQAGEGELTLDLALAAGPRLLLPEAVTPILQAAETCGPLVFADLSTEGWPLGATLRVRGDLAAEADEAWLRDALAPAIGDREVEVEATLLNPDLCRVRSVLPASASEGVSIWLGDGETGRANPAGVFHAGDNPVAVVEMPASLEDGFLWVVAVDNTGKVLNLLPHAFAEENHLSQVGTVESGIRRVTVLHPISDLEATQDRSLLATRVSDASFGKSELLAFVTRDQLFETRRPRDELIASFAEALEATLAENPGNVLAMASRVLDARP